MLDSSMVPEPFPTFPKIQTALDDQQVLKGDPWLALEKIHGAQLVIQSSEAGIRFGKRKGWLEADDPFFGYALIHHELTEQAQALSSRLAGPITIYGELFGGAYPHPEVPPLPGLAAVQSGIWYAPDLRYAAFDVAKGDEFLAHSEWARLAQSVGLFTPPLLQMGPKALLERLPLRFPSRVATLLGLPPLPDNWAEGLIIKADARSALSSRPIIKHKIPEMNELAFAESQPWDAGRQLSFPELLNWAQRLVNPARLASARSKVGAEQEAELREEVVLDVLLDLEQLFSRMLGGLSPEREQQLEQTIRRHLEALLSA